MSWLSSVSLWLQQKLGHQLSEADLQRRTARGLGETRRRYKQKYDPFAVQGETHCGDCNKLLTRGRVQLFNAIFYHGVRCEECHAVADLLGSK